MHGFVEEFEAIDFFNRFGGGGWVVEDDEGLSFCFEVGFGDQVDDVAVFGEDFGEGFFQLVGFYALFEVFGVDSV